MSAVCQSGQSSRAKVWVRTRPTANFAHNLINIQPDGKSIGIHCMRDPKKGLVNNQVIDWSFKVDGVLHNACQDDVYAATTADVVTAALDGYNGTVMCYGQTGAGKTFTTTGSTECYENRGLIPRAISQIFKEVEDRTDFSINIRISYLEIYNETMFDLLSTLPTSIKAANMNPLQVVEDEQGVYVRGLQSHLAQNEPDALNMLFEGELNRAIAAHSLNKVSSRSHCVFTVYIESRSRLESNAKYTLSKLNFVDLAGSERLGKTQSEGKTKEEAMYINKSLSFLEQVVLALADKHRDHVPFRQSKLTHYLKDSIGGHCNTRLIANIWAEAAQLEETISTLRFAIRMMSIAVEPALNLHYDPTIMVKNLEQELTLLKKELAMHDTLANRSQVNYEPLSEQQRYEIRQQVRSFLEGRADDIEVINLRQIQGVFDSFRDISNQMARDIEERLRSKYTLIDKTDPAAIAAAQQAGIPISDDGELVGDVDMKGFSVGSSSSAKPVPSSVTNLKKAKATSRKAKERVITPPSTASPVHPGSKVPLMDATQTVTPAGERDDRHDESGAVLSKTKDLVPARPSTPPPRSEAFEEFKREAGRTINQILTENKDILASKKKQYADLAQLINCTKEEMDRSLAKLNVMKEDREADGNAVTEDGDIIISEHEYLEIKRVKDLKEVYKSNYEELKAVKSQVQYCQRLVDQCRHKLIQEFDTWYEESFLGVNAETSMHAIDSRGSALSAGPHSLPPVPGAAPRADTYAEDEQERVDRVQRAWLLNQPESAAFYQAQMRTSHRKIYDVASSQAPLGVRRKTQLA